MSQRGGRGRGGRGRGRHSSDFPSFPRGGGRGSGRSGGSGYAAPSPTPSAPPRQQAPIQAQAVPPRQQAPIQTQAAPPRQPAPAQAQASSSSAAIPPPAEAALIGEMEQKLTVTAAPPSSSKAVRCPARPGFGRAGVPCQVRANHFLVEVADKDLHHYDVAITPEVTSKKVNRDVIATLVKLYKESHLGKRTPAYDGMKSIYTAGALPFVSKEFVVKLNEREGREGGSASAPRRKDREFKVSIKLASKPDLYQLQQFLRSRQHESPQDTIHVLDVVLRATPSEMYTVVGRSFFSTELGPRGELGDGMEYWRGFYQSLRPIQIGLSLNIDVSARSFYEPILVTEFVKKHFNLRDLSRPLADRDRLKVKKSLKGIKVALSYRDHRTYRITGVSVQPLSQLKFTLEDGKTETSVVKYYHEKYNIALRSMAMPALQSGSDAKPAYLPMELCTILPGQRYTRKLNERQVTALLRATCQRPRDREANIKQMVRHNNYNADNVIKEFGMQVKQEMMLIDARVLPSPQLNYHETGREAKETPRVGQWNMINKKMVNGARVDFWAYVSFSRLDQNFNSRFLGDLVTMCMSKGVHFDAQPLLPIQVGHPGQIESVLRGIHKMATKKIEEIGHKGRSLQLLIIVLPDVSGSYGTIKRICETELGIVSQCCNPKPAAKLSKQYLENLALKINVKVGGRNTVLNDAIQRRIPLVTDMPTIIFGADVTHPQPGEDSSPSIAAVVASMDWPEITKYRGIVSAQAHREEIILDLYKVTHDPQKGTSVHGGMIREHFMAFRRATGHKPGRIIFYRDGVSEGQFSQVLLHEVDAIRKACASLQEGYLPPVTFVVVQKRHHTRLFPNDHNNRGMTDRSGNILPGTVVDTKICHPTEFDFYLNSHAGIQGTSRPAHYHVLFDENRFTADQLQMLTNNLCYTYARCTRSVSLVPPAFYAHLAAFRARYYIEGEYSDTGSTAGGSSVAGAGGPRFRALPEIKDNVKDVMFYC